MADEEKAEKAQKGAGKPQLTPEQEAEAAAKKAARAEAKAKGGKGGGKGKGAAAAAEVAAERVNMVKRHTKPTQRNPRGGILEKEGSVEASNVSLWCGKCAAPRRSRHEHGEGEGQKKRRLCTKCGTAFETA